jgi:hypothetical protein
MVPHPIRDRLERITFEIAAPGTRLAPLLTRPARSSLAGASGLSPSGVAIGNGSRGPA